MSIVHEKPLPAATGTPFVPYASRAPFHLWALIVPARLPLAQCLRTVECQLEHLPYEVSVVLNANGTEVCRVTGAESMVDFTDEQLALARGGYLTHNHPGGSFFSHQDIAMAHALDVVQLRVIARATPRNQFIPTVHILHRPAHGWDLSTCKFLQWSELNRIQAACEVPGAPFEFWPRTQQQEANCRWAALAHMLVEALDLPIESHPLYETPKPLRFYLRSGRR